MDIKHNLKNAAGTVKDAVNHAIHKSTADAEHARRDVAGNTMTTGEKIGSIANEAKNDVQAGIDRAKLEARKTV